MPALDPDAVQVLAAQLHVEQCLPGSNLYHQYSLAHREVHDRAAERILTGLADTGFHLTTKET